MVGVGVIGPGPCGTVKRLEEAGMSHLEKEKTGLESHFKHFSGW